MIYLTPTQTFHTLGEAIENNESFVAATDDHQWAMFVEWDELDDEEREWMADLALYSESEVEKDMIREITRVAEEEPDEGERRRLMEDSLITLFRWMTDQNEGSTK